MSDLKVKIPCIGICSTTFGGVVCRGCKRFVHEITDWNGYSEDEKRLIEQRLLSFMAQVVESKLQVVDAKLLRTQLEHWQIPFTSECGELNWAYQLLKHAGAQIDSFDEYGLKATSEYQNHNFSELRSMIDEEFFILSRAHYDRYIRPEYKRDLQSSIELGGV